MAGEVNYTELIQQGAEQWNRWREEHPDDFPDLSRAYLYEADLSGINLKGANLNRACLIGAKLKEANLSGADLHSAYLSKAYLQGADLSGADLSETSLTEAILTAANLSSAYLAGTNLSAAHLTGICIENWQVDSQADFSDVTCEYLYKKQPQQARHPESGILAPEDFSRLVAEARTASARDPGARPATGWAEGAFVPTPPPHRGPKSAKNPFSPRQLLLLAGPIAAGLLIVALFIGFLIRLSTSPRQVATEPAAPAAVGPAVNLASLPCNELPPPDLDGQEPSQVYSSGVAFYGQFEDGIPVDGRGIMVFTNGDRYDGEFEAGQRNGCGTFTFANGRQYMGQFQADRFHGVGIWELETGERYVGQFEGGKCAGWGTFIFEDGTSKSGTWEDGTLVGEDLSCDRGVSSEPEETLL